MNNSSDAAEKFRQITEAYDTLIDPDRRRRYDRLHGTRRAHHLRRRRRVVKYTRPGNGTRAGNGSASGNGSQTASRILKILEDIWLEIRRWHPDIPPAVIIIASGTDGKQARLGHHAPGRWNVAGQQYAEVMISGEGLRRTPHEVLGTPAARSRPRPGLRARHQGHLPPGPLPQQGLQDLAEQLGLTVEHDDRFGWSAATSPLPPSPPTPASSATWPTP